jgi:hypothetical protein
MKQLILKVLYKCWEYLASKNQYTKLCEKLNLWINTLESN